MIRPIFFLIFFFWVQECGAAVPAVRLEVRGAECGGPLWRRRCSLWLVGAASVEERGWLACFLGRRVIDSVAARCLST
jgi:hypothetical protein